jgi:hypothetical protein
MHGVSITRNKVSTLGAFGNVDAVTMRQGIIRSRNWIVCVENLNCYGGIPAEIFLAIVRT